jgi:glyoxylate reductase
LPTASRCAYRWATHKGRNDMGEKVIVNIRTFMDGHRPPDGVLPSML